MTSCICPLHERTTMFTLLIGSRVIAITMALLKELLTLCLLSAPVMDLGIILSFSMYFHLDYIYFFAREKGNFIYLLNYSYPSVEGSLIVL